MNDHVARMVHGWFDRMRNDAADVDQLVDAVHRMIREAEDEMRGRCEDIAKRVAGPDLGGQIALAIRMNAPGESLPRRSLVDAYADRQSELT